mgnify:CR=1 FL=1
MTLQTATGASKKHIYRPPMPWDKIKKSMSSLRLLPALDTRWTCVLIFASVCWQNFSLARFGFVKTLLAWTGRRTHNLYMCACLDRHTQPLYACLLGLTYTAFICVLALVNTRSLHMCACFGEHTQLLFVFLRGQTHTQPLYVCLLQ